MRETIWLLTTGSGADGDEWDVKSIWSTKEKAEVAKVAYEQPHEYPNGGGTYQYDANDVEEWDVDPGKEIEWLQDDIEHARQCADEKWRSNH